MQMSFSEPSGQAWPQIAALALAFVLSALIGLEREIRNKNAGLRTYTIIGFTAALIMLVSKYGFTDVVRQGTIRVDPSRVVSHVVEGIGFIGGGLIFVHGETVRGLTTAASVWLVAAVGMACGAGLPLLAAIVTIGYFIITFGFTLAERRLPGAKDSVSELRLRYQEAEGSLDSILAACNGANFAVRSMTLEREPAFSGAEPREAPLVNLCLKLEGERPVLELAHRLGRTAGIAAVTTTCPRPAGRRSLGE